MSSTPYLSEIRLFSFGFAPAGWALCNGQLLPINQNQALFALLGATYGGDGQVNFALPDLRGRVPIHAGDESGYVLGQRGGDQNITLSLQQLPAHTHAVSASPAAAVDGNPENNVWAAAGVSAYHTWGPYQGGMFTSLHNNTITASSGGAQAHMNMQPFLTLSYCIALQGFFPTQN